MSSLTTLQEEFVTHRFYEIEKYLKRKATNPYTNTVNIIISTMQKVFEKYDNYPDTFKYLLISQDLEKVGLYKQIQQQYGVMGEEFSEFMQSYLYDLYLQTEKHSNQIITNEEYHATPFALPPSVEKWKGKTFVQGAEMVLLIKLLIYNHKSMKEITTQLELKTGGHIYEAKRMARTETAETINTTALGVWEKSGITKVKWTDATEHIQFVNRKGNKKVTKVCKNCRSFATGGEGGKGIYTINQLPSPCPAHPNCRCTLVPIKK